MLWRKRDRGREPFATEIISDLLEKITMYRIALGVSAVCNIIMAAVLISK